MRLRLTRRGARREPALRLGPALLRLRARWAALGAALAARRAAAAPPAAPGSAPAPAPALPVADDLQDAVPVARAAAGTPDRGLGLLAAAAVEVASAPARRRSALAAIAGWAWARLGTDPREALVVAAALLLLAALTLAPGLADLNTALIGDPGGDNLRGLWGLELVRHSLVPPNAALFSREFNFPFGGWALILPYASSVAAAPLGLLISPVARWNLAVLLWLWSTGFGMAAWVRTRSGSWSAGLAAGGVLMGQPMLLHAIADGTPEHLGFGTMLATLCVLELLIRRPSALRAALIGLVGGLVALDSPYQAIFLALLALERGPLTALRLRRFGGSGALVVVLVGLLCAGLAVGGLWALYGQFPAAGAAGEGLAANRAGNAVNLVHWWRLEQGRYPIRDPSLVPAALAVWTMVPAALLGLWGGLRSSLTLLTALLLAVLALGVGAELAAPLSGWLGGAGAALAQAIDAWNGQLYALPGISSVRFPRRFLVPAAMALLVAAGVGWAAIEEDLRRGRGPALRAALLGLGFVIALVGGQEGQRVMGLQHPFPRTVLPAVAAMDFIAAHPEPGAVALLPEKRASRRALQRHELPVFGGLDAALGGAAPLYLQVLHGRPQVGFPALLTLAPRERTPRARGLLEDWDQLANPATLGEPPPVSATRPEDDGRRAVGLDLLLREGLRFLVLDDALYAETERAALRRQLGAHLAEEQVFDDGTGLRVIVLRP
jgi:hypothetical protein